MRLLPDPLKFATVALTVGLVAGSPLYAKLGDREMPETARHLAHGHLAPRAGLSLEGARVVLHAAVSEAQRLGVGGAFAVVDEAGNLLALERVDGTFPAAPLVSLGKARTAATFRKPTSFFEKSINEGRTAMVTVEGFTPLQGGVPIVLDGQVVGAIGVSGASSAAQDEELARFGAAALVEMP